MSTARVTTFKTFHSFCGNQPTATSPETGTPASSTQNLFLFVTGFAGKLQSDVQFFNSSFPLACTKLSGTYCGYVVHKATCC